MHDSVPCSLVGLSETDEEILDTLRTGRAWPESVTRFFGCRER
ncbi:MAG: hypothetical protein Q8M11_00035 [Sulfuritalea sp.]|nr:hypothetical protein [Sulfuritalea sp.]MDP1985076.1 hypothetical protein [Sulfuritalea sp.]